MLLVQSLQLQTSPLHQPDEQLPSGRGEEISPQLDEAEHHRHESALEHSLQSVWFEQRVAMMGAGFVAVSTRSM